MKKKQNVGTLFTLPVLVCSVILAVILFMALFGDYLAPYDPEAVNVVEAYMNPCREHLLGTDDLGHDQLSRLLSGAGTTILNAVIVVLISVVVGVPLGLVCGYYEGVADNIIMRVWDILLAFPTLLLAFVFVAVFGRGEWNAVLAIGIVYIPMISKLTRSLMLTEKSKVYVEAARSMGYSDIRIMFVHILPNCVNTMMAELTLDVGYAIISLASLSYLGLGVQPPKADWGTMLQQGMKLLYRAPLVALIPGFAIMLTVVSLNVVSDGIQMYMDPDQRKLPSFKKYRKKLARQSR